MPETDFEKRFRMTGEARRKWRDEAIKAYNIHEPMGCLKALLEYVAADYGCQLETDKKGCVKLVEMEGCPQRPTGAPVKEGV